MRAEPDSTILLILPEGEKEIAITAIDTPWLRRNHVVAGAALGALAVA